MTSSRRAQDMPKACLSLSPSTCTLLAYMLGKSDCRALLLSPSACHDCRIHHPREYWKPLRSLQARCIRHKRASTGRYLAPLIPLGPSTCTSIPPNPTIKDCTAVPCVGRTLSSTYSPKAPDQHTEQPHYTSLSPRSNLTHKSYRFVHTRAGVLNSRPTARTGWHSTCPQQHSNNKLCIVQKRQPSQEPP